MFAIYDPIEFTCSLTIHYFERDRRMAILPAILATIFIFCNRRMIHVQVEMKLGTCKQTKKKSVIKSMGLDI